MAAAAREMPGVVLAGVMTHFATADDLKDDGFFARQLVAFTRWAREVKGEDPEIIVHAANSAATCASRSPFRHGPLRDRDLRHGPVRQGPRRQGLEPALELDLLRRGGQACRAGESAGYGRRFVAEEDTCIGVLPIGYGDGWRRGCPTTPTCSIGGQRHPLVGTVSMDSITVDLGPERAARLRGSAAILIGFQGQRITAEEVARRLDTINYEVTCALTPGCRGSTTATGLRCARRRTAASADGGRRHG